MTRFSVGVLGIFGLIIGLWTLQRCDPRDGPAAQQEVVEFTGATMGTTWLVRVPRDQVPAGDPPLPAIIEQELDAVNGQMSNYRPDSEISVFNRTSGTDWFPVSPEFAAVVATALDIGRASGGAFDVTVGPLVDLWGFGPGSGADQVPTDAAIDAARSIIGMEHLEVRTDPPALRKGLPSIRLDLSAIAKGHGVDRVVAALERRGVRSAFVEIGGEVFARGRREASHPWRVGIEQPDDLERHLALALPLENEALATSGDYWNFWMEAGRKYSHTIDPRTGRPVVHALASVSVRAGTCELADAWATALNVLGPEKARALAAQQGLAVRLVVRTEPGQFETWTSPRWGMSGQ